MCLNQPGDPESLALLVERIRLSAEVTVRPVPTSSPSGLTGFWCQRKPWRDSQFGTDIRGTCTGDGQTRLVDCAMRIIGRDAEVDPGQVADLLRLHQQATTCRKLVVDL